MALNKHTWLYSDLLRAFKGKHSSALGFLSEGSLIFLRPQCPITRTHLRQRGTESCNILNCSNNKIIYGNGLFCHNKWVAKRQGHRNLEFHTVHLLEPAPQTQTATAHLQTTWTVYFDGQGTQILPRGKIRGGGGGAEGGTGWLMVYFLWCGRPPSIRQELLGDYSALLGRDPQSKVV